MGSAHATWNITKQLIRAENPEPTGPSCHYRATGIKHQLQFSDEPVSFSSVLSDNNVQVLV
jgi:hypothetical protein